MSVSISQLIDSFREQYGDLETFHRVPVSSGAHTINQYRRTLSHEYRNLYALPVDLLNPRILRLANAGYDFFQLVTAVLRVSHGLQLEPSDLQRFLRSQLSFAQFSQRHLPRHAREEEHARQFVEAEEQRVALRSESNRLFHEQPGMIQEPILREIPFGIIGPNQQNPIPGIGVNINAGQNVRRLIDDLPPRPQEAGEDPEVERKVRQDEEVKREIREEQEGLLNRMRPGDRLRYIDYTAEQIEDVERAYPQIRGEHQSEGLGPQFDPGTRETIDEKAVEAAAHEEHRSYLDDLAATAARDVARAGAQAAVRRLRGPVQPKRLNVYDAAAVGIGASSMVINYLGRKLVQGAAEYLNPSAPPHHTPQSAPPPEAQPTPAPPRGTGEPMENPYERLPAILPQGYAYYPNPFKHKPQIDRRYVGNYHLPVVGRHNFIRWTKYTENNAIGTAY